MIHNHFGNKIFFDALNAYLETHKYGTSRPNYLISAIQDRVDEESDLSRNVDVSAFINSWTTQSGYPVVHVDLRGDKLIFRQVRIKYENISLVFLGLKKNFSF